MEVSRSVPARAAGFVRHHATRAGQRGLERWRRASLRVVSMPPETGIGVGNMFSFWLWAHHGRLLGEDRWVRRTPAMDQWLGVFPDVRPLVIDDSQVRFRDRRDDGWYQDFDRFPRDHFESFIRDRLLTSPTLPLDDGDRSVVTVNVRRGDYYSDPRFRELYGFDVVGYLRTAMAGAAGQHPIAKVEVVSDDPAWCQRELAFLADYGDVGFQKPGDGPVENLAQLAAARRLVLTNSTFSYWAAYLSNVRHGNNYAMVWAPEFHRRGINGGRAFQLDPRWSVVPAGPDIVGGGSSS